ncbi:ENAH actin regulator enabled isoform X2 [Haematobia irritans]|uniref:ENAH actin regulator enabled isoform X2 n=1 Tax=Haematobia irritans TaxID=7368 RepID=UPI003F504F25
MKKLYAKTSFSSKNRKVSSKNENDLSPSNSSNGSSDIIKYHDPILAYQPSKSKDFINESNKYKPKHPFGAKLQNLEQLRNPQFSLIENSNGISPQNYDESPYYYTITELENLHMLDHRHPHFHQHHRMQQQQQQMHHQLHATSPNGSLSSSSAPHTKVYHQHNQLVLQLPIVSSTTSTSTPTNSSTSSLAPDAVDSSMSPNNSMRSPPIYEAPQRMNSIASSILSRSSSNLSSSSPSSQRISTTSPPPHQFYGIAFNDYEYHYDQQQGQQQHPQMSYPNQVHQHSAPVRQQQLSSSSGSITSPCDNLSSNADFMTNSISPTLFAEQSIIGARASVMVYDDNQKKWVPSGTSSGLSKVQIYHHQQNNTFRVVGRKLQDHEVVINCSILKGLKYNQATATFHQWRDSKYVYGLNFSSPNDAEAFARAMMHALEVLSGRVANNPGQPTNGNGYEEDMGYRTMTSEDAAILRQQQQITGQVTPSAQTPTSQTNQNNIPQSPPTPQQGHHRTSSAPPAPQPPHMQQQQQQQQQQQHSIYGHTTGGGPTQNGMQQHPQPPMQQQQQQIPPGPGQPQQQQYHAPTQMQQPPPQQQQQHGLYATQQMVNAGAYQQQQNQYQQPHYVLSNSNPNLNNMHQYPQQQPIGGMIPQAPQPPMPPPHQNGGGPSHYVSSQQQMGPGIPNSQSANGIYGSQPQMGGGVPMPPQPPQPPAMPNGPPAPPNAYGQMNGGGQVQQTENPYGQAPGAPPMMPVNSNAPVGNVPMPPPLNRMSNTSGGPGGAPVPGAPAPPPPPAFGGAPPMYNGNVGGGAPVPPPPQPPAPPAPPAMGGPAAPPPPPPPPIGGGGGSAAKKDDPQADLMGSLAAQLQQAKLKKKSTPAATENSGSSTPSGGSGNYGTIGRGGGGSGGGGGGMASMMDEMAKTLARRRAQAEKKEPEPEPEVKQRPWEKSNTLPHKLGSSSSANSSNSNANSHNTSNSGSESPRPIRKRFGSASEETILKVNGDGLSMAALSGSDLEQLKAEIVREMKTEIQKVKQEIIDAIKSEFNRR